MATQEDGLERPRVLILMRHAKSDWSQPNLSDHDRALNVRGGYAAPRMARHLKEHGLEPDVVLASTAVRVEQTLQLMQAEGWAEDAKVVSRKALYLASPKQLIDTVEGIGEQYHKAIIMGHNPGMCSLACHLAGQDLEMPTAAVAVFTSTAVSWRDSIAAGNWTFEAHWKPRELKDDSIGD